MVSCDIATAGAVMPNVPPMIAKAATTAAVMNVVFNNDGKNTIDLNDIREYSVISFVTRCVGYSVEIIMPKYSRPVYTTKNTTSEDFREYLCELCQTTFDTEGNLSRHVSTSR
jgi:hypothetical protein